VALRLAAISQGYLLQGFESRLLALGRSPVTVKNYRHHVKNLRKSYPDLPFELLSAEHIERHLYARKITPRAKIAELAGIKAFYKYLVHVQKLVPSNPCDNIEKPKYRDAVMPAPTFAEFEALFARCRDLEERVLVNLFYQTAVRLREGITLKVKHIRLADREIRVEHGKGNKDRISVFDPEGLPEHLKLTPLLKIWAGGRDPEDWLFPARQGEGHRNHYWVQGIIRRLGEEIGLPYRLRPHLLRHGWVLWSAEAGLPIDAAQEQLGHSSIATTAGAYRKMTSPRLRRAIDKYMGQGFAPTSGGNKILDSSITPRYSRSVKNTMDRENGNGAKNVQIGDEAHDILREVAYLERRTIRSVLEEAVQILKAQREAKSK
jgi:integrase